MNADPAQQRALADLADADTAVARVGHRRARLPEQQRVAEAEAALQQARDRVAVLQLLVDDLDDIVRRHEADIDTVARREQRDRALLAGDAVNAKQAADLQHELETLARRRTALEDALLEVMERREQRDAERAAAQEDIEPAQARHDTAVRDRGHVLDDLDSEENRTQAHRDELAAGIDAELLDLYERHRATGATGAGRLLGRRCGACRMELDRGELARIAATAADVVVRCPECRAVLVRIPA